MIRFKYLLGLILLGSFLVVAFGNTVYAQESYEEKLTKWREDSLRIAKENEKKLAAAAEKSQENKKRKLYNDARQQYKYRNWASALKNIDQALEIDSTYVRAHYLRALVLKNMRRYDEAVGAYKTAIRHDPSYAKSYFGLGKLLTQLGRYNEAVANYKQALETDPNSYKAHYELALVYVKQNKPKVAVQELKAAININPSYYKAYYVLGDLQLKQGNVKAAVDALETAVALNQKKQEAHYLLATAYNRQGSYSKALRQAKEGMKIKGNFSSALAWEAATAAKSMGNVDLAIRYFQTAAADSRYKEGADFEIKQLRSNSSKG